MSDCVQWYLFTSPSRALLRERLPLSRQGRQLEVSGDLVFHKEGRTLVTLVQVLFVDGRVVLLRAFAALQHYRHQLTQLVVSVAGIMYMCLSLLMS